jgi:hypothetical protein
MKKMPPQPPEYPYTVRFRLEGKTYWDITVRASSLDKAILLAKVEAGRQSIPVFQTRIEVL